MQVILEFMHKRIEFMRESLVTSKFCREKANDIRKQVFRMATKAKGSHLGTAFSCIDILTILYFRILKINPKKPKDINRDRFILSKGHACSGLYVTLAEKGFFAKKLLKSYLKDGTIFAAHPSSGIPGIELSTGSLGHGLSVGVGMAIAAKHDRRHYKVYVLISDGECDEGSTWEAVLCASHFKLDNLVVIVDYNKIQAFGRVEDVLGLEPFKDKWQSFGFAVREIDGHNHSQIIDELENVPFVKGKPSVIIAHTIKGKGVSFMENTIDWHYLNPNEQQLKIALKELNKIK